MLPFRRERRVTCTECAAFDLTDFLFDLLLHSLEPKFGGSKLELLIEEITKAEELPTKNYIRRDALEDYLRRTTYEEAPTNGHEEFLRNERRLRILETLLAISPMNCNLTNLEAVLDPLNSGQFAFLDLFF